MDWYLLMAKPREDARAEENLRNQGFCVFRPTVEVKGQRQSLFARYLFIQLDAQNQNWAPIRSTRGVAGLVRFGQNWARVPAVLVEDLMSEDGQKRSQAQMDALSALMPGDTLKVLEGGFMGSECLFKHLDAQGRVVVLMKIIGHWMEIALASHQVQKTT
jgi:transcriptional antiterminator RfaH